MGMLSEHDRELIYCLLRSQDMFELPREEDIQQVTVRGHRVWLCCLCNQCQGAYQGLKMS